MRQRTKMVALCSHTTPTNSYMSREEILKKKFQSGNITTEELKEYAAIKAASNKAPISVTVFIWGKPMTISYSEYLRHYKHLGFNYKVL